MQPELRMRCLPQLPSCLSERYDYSPDAEIALKAAPSPVDFRSRMVTCNVDELRPHPSFARHHLTVPASNLSALAEQGDLVFQQPLAITQDRTIIDGYARWKLARLEGRTTLLCMEYELSEAEALRFLLQTHHRSNGLNDFNKIVLALDLEPSLHESARANEQAGGRSKGSSNLTKAEKLDVRREIAIAAGVSTGNVTKVKQLIATAHPEILDALRSGEIRIHRAWLWRKLPREAQRDQLRTHRVQKGVKGTLRTLVARHRPTNSPEIPAIGDLARQLAAVETSGIGPVMVNVIKAPGRAVFITEELFRELGLQKELALTCPPKNH